MNDGEGTSRSGCRTEGWKVRPGENCFEPSSKYMDKDQFFMSDDRFELLLGDILLGVSNNSGNGGLVGEILSPHGDQEDGVANGYEDEDDADDGVLEKDRFAEQTSVNDDDFEDPKVGEENMNQGAENIRTEIIEFHGDRDVEVGGDDMNEDLVYVGLHSRPCSDDDDDEAREVYPDYHPAVGMQLPVFEVSMKFGSRAQFREAVKTTKILTGRPVKVTYNDNRSLAPPPSTIVGSSSGTNKRKGPPNSLVKKTLSDKIAHNMNCEFLGEPAPYKIGRWAKPKRRARLS